MNSKRGGAIQNRAVLGRRASVSDDVIHQMGTGASAPAYPDRLDPHLIDPNPFQPRELFGGKEDAALAESVRRHGIIHALVARPHPADSGRFQLVAGERRLRAALEVGMELVPVRVLELGDLETAEMAVVENELRRKLSMWENAKAVRRVQDLLEGAGQEHHQEAVAAALDISTGLVSKRMGIVDGLTPEVIAAAGFVDAPPDQVPEGKRCIYDLSQDALSAIARVQDVEERIAQLADWTPGKRGGRRAKKPFEVLSDGDRIAGMRLNTPVWKLEDSDFDELYEQVRLFVSDLLVERARRSGRSSLIDDRMQAGGAMLFLFPKNPSSMSPEEITENLDRVEPLLELHREWSESGLFAKIRAAKLGELQRTGASDMRPRSSARQTKRTRSKTSGDTTAKSGK